MFEGYLSARIAEIFNYPSFFSSQTDSSHSHQDYQQLKLLPLQLWQDQQQKLGNPLPSNADLYQIMRQDHPLGIDAFVSQACQLSPHVNPIQVLHLLQKCIRSCPKLVANAASALGKIGPEAKTGPLSRL